MSLKFPDVLEHANDNYPLVDINSMKGLGSVIDKTTRNSIPLDKRKNLFVCQVGVDRHVYLHTLLTDTYWQDDLNWRVDNDIFTKVDGSNIDKYEFAQNLSTVVDTVQTFYINTDSLTDGDGTIGNPWNSFTGFADYLKDKTCRFLISTSLITVNVDGIAPLKITKEDAQKCRNANIDIVNTSSTVNIDIKGTLIQLCSIISVVRDSKYPCKYYIDSPDFNSTTNFYRYKSVKSGTAYYTISASGNDIGGNYIITNVASFPEDVMLNVSTFANGGIYEPKTSIRSSKDEIALNLGSISSSIRFIYFTITNLDCITGDSYTYIIGNGINFMPIFTECFFNIGNVETQCAGSIRFVRCSFSSSSLNVNSFRFQNNAVFLECTLHGLRIQDNRTTHLKIRNLQLIASATSINKLTLTQDVELSGYTVVVASANFSLIQVGINLALWSLSMNIDKLIIVKQSGTMQLITYNTSNKKSLFLNINEIIGDSYDTLSNVTDKEFLDPESQRRVIIGGKDLSLSQRVIMNFDTISEINNIGIKYPFVSCMETSRIYKYVSEGLSYNVDDINVLNTVDGGDTRFVDVNYFNDTIDVSVGTGGDFANITLLQDFLNKNKYIKNVVVNFVSDVLGSFFYLEHLKYLEINDNGYSANIAYTFKNCEGVEFYSEYEGPKTSTITIEDSNYAIIEGVFPFSEIKIKKVNKGTIEFQNSMTKLNLTVDSSNAIIENAHTDFFFAISSNVNFIGEGRLYYDVNQTGNNIISVGQYYNLSSLSDIFKKTHNQFYGSSGASLIWIVENKGVFITDEDAVDLSTDQIIKSGIKTFNQYPQKKVYEIGDEGPAGGVISLIDTTVSPNVYYELAPTSAGSFAFKTERTESLGTSTTIGTGITNTIALAGALHPAAEACRNYSNAGFDDWFLPSIDELVGALNNVARTADQRSALGIAVNSFVIWSSSDYDAINAYASIYASLENPPSYYPMSQATKTGSTQVRPMRSFTGSVPLPLNENEFVTKSYADNNGIILEHLNISSNTILSFGILANYKIISVIIKNYGDIIQNLSIGTTSNGNDVVYRNTIPSNSITVCELSKQFFDTPSDLYVYNDSAWGTSIIDIKIKIEKVW